MITNQVTDAPGSYLRARRQILGWRQHDVARATGINRFRLSLAENGHIALRPDELEAVEQAFRMAARQQLEQLQVVTAALGVSVQEV